MAKTEDRVEVNGKVYFSSDYFLKMLDRAIENVKRAMIPKEPKDGAKELPNTSG